MSEQSLPFDASQDPFTPETVRFLLPDGQDIVDIGATALNHIESPLPRIDSSNLTEGDILSVEYDDDTKETYEIENLIKGSLVFGSDDVRIQQVSLKPKVDGTEELPNVRLYGSAVSPTGMMLTPGTIRVGSYLATDFGVSPGTIRSFDLKRLDKDGTLKSVTLNKNERKIESNGYSDVLNSFSEMSALIGADGFKFEDVDDDEILDDGYVIEGGFPARYRRVHDNLLVFAGRQGFGYAIEPQDEIWVYDANSEVLRAMRNIPNQGIFQMAIAEGVTKEMLQKAGIGFSHGDIPDWRESHLEGSTLHRLSDDAPVISYTWLSPAQESPTITILEAGEKVSNILKTPKQKGAVFIENLQAHGAEDLIETIQQHIGINPYDKNYVYENLEVNIHPSKEPEVRINNAYLWDGQHMIKDVVDKLKSTISFTLQKSDAKLIVDGHEIVVRTDITKEAEQMVSSTRLALSGL